jgi:hypothetical protein
VNDDGRKPQSSTVFGAPDQEAMIARIDATSEDDLSSGFFTNSVEDAEAAAVRMFDIGIRTMTDEPADPLSTTFAPTASQARQPATATAQEVAPGAADRFADASARAAFILGGPCALAA